MKPLRIMAPIVLVVLAVTATVPAAEEGPAFPKNPRWDLSTVYSDEAAWKKAKDDLGARIEQLDRWKGHLGDSAETLKQVLGELFAVDQEMSRLGSYATMRSDLDIRNPKSNELRQEMGLLETRLGEKTAWIEPELLSLNEKDLWGFFDREAGLAPYRQYVRNVLRRRAHTLSNPEEKLLASTGLLSSVPGNIYRMFTNAEMPFPEFTRKGGATIILNQAAYTRLRSDPDRQERSRVFREFFGTYKKFEGTLGASLYGQVKRDVFFARARKYDTALEASLDVHAVPVAIYRNLVRETNANLATLHRYLKLRKRLLGLDELGYQDLYTPLVADVGESYPMDRAMSVVVHALAPLGPDYVAKVRNAFTGGGWIDAPPRPGKRQGAYSNGSIYDLHPFVLLNHNDDYESLSTLAHEMGHAMHSALANARQPYPTSQYPIFVAEIASTFNEVLLNRYLRDHAPNDEEKLFFLGSFLDSMRTTYFRQAMFAEFEMRIHDVVEKGESLTGENLSKIYGSLLRRYYGQDQGICTVDPLYDVEWAYIPHFYYDFYVYQYATGIVSSSYLATRVLAGEPGARERYLDFLSSGGADYPAALLRKAGVDLTTSEPYKAAFALMNSLMDEIEAILDRRDRAAEGTR